MRAAVAAVGVDGCQPVKAPRIAGDQQSGGLLAVAPAAVVIGTPG